MFKVVKKNKNTQARRGILKTAHGNIETPFFMTVATQGAVKHLTTSEMRSIGAPILLSNTYHLMLRPGSALIKKIGGLHKFMNWDGPILTDSGGFQVFSLGSTKPQAKAALVSGPPSFKTTARQGKSLVKLTDKGVDFSSYVDGSRYHLSPEDSLKIQRELGVDIAVCLDECVALPATKEYITQSVELTSRWARRSKDYWQKVNPPVGGAKPLLFAVIQGGLDKQLRLKSLADLASCDFDGYNIGGLSVGESAKEMYKVLDYLVEAMPINKPRYLMGVGYPDNILEAVKRGVDMFDCVIPTREGRHGRLFVFKANADKQIALALKGKKYAPFYEQININNAKFAKDYKVINANSESEELKKLTKAYLNYLFKISEPLGQRLASLNNIEFYLQLMAKIRKNI
jgi:queuine tRNA-ribosyltransferase